MFLLLFHHVRSASGRLLAASWWFFSFVAISTYTANLASFLTRERLRSPIQSAEDLVKQSDVRYGCVRSGSTEAFFKASSPYRNLLSSAILRLQESGTLQLLKERWWNVDTRGRCPEDAGSGVSSLSAASELGLSKVGGVFVVLLAGLGFACIIAVAEFLCKARSLRSKRRYRRSIKP
ncbi:hypothetical protein HPB47_020423, partial [Ixodes persulcatus]